MIKDKGTVMTWLRICGKNKDCSGMCPYSDDIGRTECCQEILISDAYDLLQEQHKEIEDLKSMIVNMHI